MATPGKFSTYDSIYHNSPFDEHPENCPCIYHQIRGDKLLEEASAAERIDWAYAFYNHPDQLTRESTLKLFQSRNNWAKIHSYWVERDEYQAEVLGYRILNAAAFNERSRKELDYRVQFLGLPNRGDFDDNWRKWQRYIRDRGQLLEPGGAMRRCQVVWRVLVALMKQAGQLYEEFWDLEEARRGVGEVNAGCEGNLKKLQANLKQLQSCRHKLQDEEAAIFELREKAPPPDWVGGLTAPTRPSQPPQDGDPLLRL